ncbi:hypothetical protein NQZ68_032587 [Dissostichus eleginoides]|nr:hypothetical protein NQZ68_032587 [Dissostichus eleginoides]
MFSRSGLRLLALAEEAAVQVSLVNVNHAVSQVQQVVWLIWLPWKCALGGMSSAAQRLQESHSG